MVSYSDLFSFCLLDNLEREIIPIDDVCSHLPVDYAIRLLLRWKRWRLKAR